MTSSTSVRFALVFAAAFAVACGAPASVATAPTPARSQPAVTAPTGVPAVTMSEPPTNWHLLDETTDHVPGISLERAMHELLANKQPKRTVLVAIIDNGIDTNHVDLKANLWSNPREIPGNGKDDDNNGHVDDIHGWNFIGSRTGEDVHFDTFEVTREYARCHNLPAASGEPPLTDATYCSQIDSEFNKQRTEIVGGAENLKQIHDLYQQIVPLLASAIRADSTIPRASRDSVTPATVRALHATSQQVGRARDVYLNLADQGATPQVIDEEYPSIAGQAQYSVNPDFDSRKIVGDHYTDVTERNYGNADVMGQDAMHGTHVAGIIGAVRGNGIGMDGVASAVKLMMIRTVPDGDERDKDIANAIRYATDNGAQIISMSFGKGYSPYKSAVDEAVKYADSKGVLMVHAAGNDGADLATAKNFPTPNYIGGGRPTNWIEVGASSWKGGDSLAAGFSNYGQHEVDVFAPGVDIYSTLPGNHYGNLSGTSMAAPVVSGLAAVLMGYYPNLTAGDVKRIIMASTMNVGTQMVARPGSGSRPQVSFGTLSVTGGIVNAYNAVKMAEDVSNGKARP